MEKKQDNGKRYNQKVAKTPTLTRSSVDLWLKDLDYTKNKAMEFVKLAF